MERKVILFDMDGVLIDDGRKTEAYIKTFRKLGVNVNSELLKEGEIFEVNGKYKLLR